MTPDERSQTIERERRWALPAAAAALLGMLLAVGAGFVPIEGLGEAASDAEELVARDRESAKVMLASALNAAGLALLSIPLTYLFRAAAARSDQVRRQLIGIVVLGPLLLAIGGILTALAFDQMSSDFVAQSAGLDAEAREDLAEELRVDSTLLTVGSGFFLGGLFGLTIGLVYTCLHAMRTGLLTRFVGMLGIGLGIALILLFGQLLPAVYLYIGVLGLLFAGRWPGGRPPAWDAGVAMPWPKPGEQPPAESAAEPESRSAEEIFGSEEERQEGEDAGRATGAPHPASKKRKRKRRR